MPKRKKQSIFLKENHIQINTKLIPDFVRDDLAKATLEAVISFLQQPGGRDMLDARIAARRSNEALKKA